jgi:hypothetical protein
MIPEENDDNGDQDGSILARNRNRDFPNMQHECQMNANFMRCDEMFHTQWRDYKVISIPNIF